MPVPTDVVLKLMAPLIQRGYNVTCHNYFTSLGLALILVEKKCSIVGTLRQNRREASKECKKENKRHKTEVFRYDDQTAITLTSYQCKASKHVAVFEQLALGYPCFKRRKPKKEI